MGKQRLLKPRRRRRRARKAGESRRRRHRVSWSMGGVSSQPTRGLREGPELPQRGPGQSPRRKRILAYYEDHRVLLFAPI